MSCHTSPFDLRDAEAVKFVSHRDGMVRTAVKTLTLNVYAIPLPAVQRFVTQPPAASYLEELGVCLAEQCQARDWDTEQAGRREELWLL